MANTLKTFNRGNNIIDEKFTIHDLKGDDKMRIHEGDYSYPFTIYLPDWLPQSQLCICMPNPKNPKHINIMKTRYNVIAAVHLADGTILQKDV